MFNRLKTEDYPALKSYFERHLYPLCEYSLPSIIAWNHCIYEVSWKIEGDLLLVAETDIEPPADRRLLMPLPLPFREVAPAELADIACANRRAPFYYVPEDYYCRHREELEKRFTAAEQPGYADYIYSTQDLARLAGHKYSKKRNLVAQFNRAAAAGLKVSLEPVAAANGQECLQLLDKWSHDPDTGANGELLACERKAIGRALKYWDRLELRGLLVRLDGAIAGFALGSPLGPDGCVLNFEKAMDGVKGLYQFLDQEFAKSLPPSCAFVNKESDLGKPGLAKAKDSYYPCRKVKSYTLHLK